MVCPSPRACVVFDLTKGQSLLDRTSWRWGEVWRHLVVKSFSVLEFLGSTKASLLLTSGQLHTSGSQEANVLCV